MNYIKKETDEMNYINRLAGYAEFSDKVIVCDPCELEPDVKLENVLPGRYFCVVREIKNTAWRSISVIFAIHEDFINEIPHANELLDDVFVPVKGEIECAESGLIYVDSGQGGIFDAAYYAGKKEGDEQIKAAYPDYSHQEDTWYNSVCCTITLKRPFYGTTDEKGFISASCYGDGAYGVYTYRDRRSGKITGIAIDFDAEPHNGRITDDKEEDDENPEQVWTLDETIQNFYNAENGSWDENDYNMLAWLEELRDLRAILKERAPGEEKAEENNEEDEFYDGPITLKNYLEMLDPATDEEEEMEFWAGQLLKARKRIGDDDARKQFP